jgi:hypothetical protein
MPDALRAKQLPLYGYTKIKTEAIDNLARDGVIFYHCYTNYPGTIGSFSALFSGMWSASDGLKNNEKTLAQYLKENGYRTAGFVSSDVLRSPDFDKRATRGLEFHRGFNEYVQDLPRMEFSYYRPNEETTRDILDWLKRQQNSNVPFFLFAHYMDPHSPYDPDYDSEIEKIDKELARIIQALKQLSFYDNSLVIFSSDHGDSPFLGEHASPLGHGWFLYTEAVQVPLIMKFPDREFNTSMTQIVRNIDIMPTILDYISSDYPRDQLDGRSLIPAIKENKNLGLISYQHVDATRVCPEGAESVIFYVGNSLYQYIAGSFSDRYREFYNIFIDPEENNNLFYDPKYKKLVKQANRILISVKNKFSGPGKPFPSQTPRRLTEKELEILKSLGYLAGGAPGPSANANPELILMHKNLGRLGNLKFTNFIREPKWGIDFFDQYYPSKIITSDNKGFFMIADKDRRVIHLTKKQNFRPLGMQNIEDIAYDSKKKILFLIENHEIKLAHVSETIKLYENSELNQWNPCFSIYIDGKNHRYLLQAEKILKLDENNKKVWEYPIPGIISGQLVVDKDENIYTLRDNNISKFDKIGRFLLSFGKDQFQKINSITIDKNSLIWALEFEFPLVRIFDTNGREITSFVYDTYKRDSSPSPGMQIFICANNIYIIDHWEGILVYTLSKEKERN